MESFALKIFFDRKTFFLTFWNVCENETTFEFSAESQYNELNEFNFFSSKNESEKNKIKVQTNSNQRSDVQKLILINFNAQKLQSILSTNSMLYLFCMEFMTRFFCINCISFQTKLTFPKTFF